MIKVAFVIRQPTLGPIVFQFFRIRFSIKNGQNKVMMTNKRSRPLMKPNTFHKQVAS